MIITSRLQHVDAEDEGLAGAILVCFNITEDGISRQRLRATQSANLNDRILRLALASVLVRVLRAVV